MGGSTLSRPDPSSGLETAVFAEGIYSCHIFDAECVLPVARYIFLGDNPCSLARQGMLAILLGPGATSPRG